MDVDQLRSYLGGDNSWYLYMMALTLLTATVVLLILLKQRVAQPKVYNNHATLETPVGENSQFTACSSPECVRCHKYKTIRSRAWGNFLEYKKRNPSFEAQLQRLETCLEGQGSTMPLSNQQPNVLYMSGLTAEPWWDTNQPAFKDHMKSLEQSFDRIHDECIEVMESGHEGWTSNITETGRWSTFYFYNQGNRVQSNCQMCPVTISALEGIPALMRGSLFGNALFSVLHPGTYIEEHCGPCNVRLRCHLGLSVPQCCHLTVGGEPRTWETGKCVIFDDSFKHSAEYSDNTKTTTQPRVVLMLDIWHPDLTGVEIHALQELFQCS